MRDARVLSTAELVAEEVPDGTQVMIGGFAFDDPMSFAYELVRQGRAGLEVLKTSGGLLVDLLLGAGCVDSLLFCHVWNSVGPAPAHAFRRAVEQGRPHRPRIDELSFGSFTMALAAGSWGLPFLPTTPMSGAGHDVNRGFLDEKLGVVESPFDDQGRVTVVRALTPRVGVFHVHRVDRFGNAQVNGPTAEMRQSIAACDRVFVIAEEMVSPEVIRERPELTVAPGFLVDGIVIEPWSAHPTDSSGYYARDLGFHLWYEEQTRTEESFARMVELIRSTAGHGELLERMAIPIDELRQRERWW